MTNLILVVEDDDQLREMVVQLLTAHHYPVVAVRLAQDALEAVERFRPEIILLDLGMPAGEMPGEEFLNRLRENPRWAGVSVIILSGLGDVVNPDVASALGVRAVLQKPVQLPRLLEALAAVA